MKLPPLESLGSPRLLLPRSFLDLGLDRTGAAINTIVLITRGLLAAVVGAPVLG